jgi:isopentenyl-diphosphate delta-isomerase
MSLCTLVDPEDNVVNYKERYQLQKGDIYRISTLWLVNSKGEVLLTQRALTKRNDPGRWGPAVGGTVEDKESYEENIVKEAREELGIVDVSFVTGPKLYVPDNGYGLGYYCQVFIAKLDWPTERFKLQAEEVSSVKWAPIDVVIAEAKVSPASFTANFANAVVQVIAFMPKSQ